jgi:hypothetical protein
LFRAAAAGAEPLDAATYSSVQQVRTYAPLRPARRTSAPERRTRRAADVRRACSDATQVSAVLNLVAVPVALTLSTSLFFYMSLKGDVAKLETNFKAAEAKSDANFKAVDANFKAAEAKSDANFKAVAAGLAIVGVGIAFVLLKLNSAR